MRGLIILSVILILSRTSKCDILNWTCDASEGNHLVCNGTNPTNENYNYLNFTNCSYFDFAALCPTVYDPSQNTSFVSPHFVVCPNAFSDYSYPCFAYSILTYAGSLIGHYYNNTVTSVVQNNTLSLGMCNVYNNFLWFKTTYDCQSQPLFTSVTDTELLHCTKYTWIAWIFGNKLNCMYMNVTPYEVD